MAVAPRLHTATPRRMSTIPSRSGDGQTHMDYPARGNPARSPHYLGASTEGGLTYHGAFGGPATHNDSDETKAGRRKLLLPFALPPSDIIAGHGSSGPLVQHHG